MASCSSSLARRRRTFFASAGPSTSITTADRRRNLPRADPDRDRDHRFATFSIWCPASWSSFLLKRAATTSTCSNWTAPKPKKKASDRGLHPRLRPRTSAGIPSSSAKRHHIIGYCCAACCRCCMARSSKPMKNLIFATPINFPRDEAVRSSPTGAVRHQPPGRQHRQNVPPMILHHSMLRPTSTAAGRPCDCRRTCRRRIRQGLPDHRVAGHRHPAAGRRILSRHHQA